MVFLLQWHDKWELNLSGCGIFIALYVWIMKLETVDFSFTWVDNSVVLHIIGVCFSLILNSHPSFWQLPQGLVGDSSYLSVCMSVCVLSTSGALSVSLVSSMT